MVCKVCGNEIVNRAVQCDRCTALVSNMRDVSEKDMSRLPIKWLLGFAVIPNLLLTLSFACLNSAEWYDLYDFLFVLAIIMKVLLLSLDRRELVWRDRKVKNWTYIGIICAPVYILFRDKISLSTVLSFVLWSICFFIFLFS